MSTHQHADFPAPACFIPSTQACALVSHAPIHSRTFLTLTLGDDTSRQQYLQIPCTSKALWIQYFFDLPRFQIFGSACAWSSIALRHCRERALCHVRIYRFGQKGSLAKGCSAVSHLAFFTEPWIA